MAWKGDDAGVSHIRKGEIGMDGRGRAIGKLKGPRDPDFPFGTFLFSAFIKRKGGNKVEKILFLGWLFLFLPAMGFAQEKVDAPVWNTGDKWVFDREGPMEVIGCDDKCYSIKFSGGIFSRDVSGIAIFERSTLNVTYMLEKERRKKYMGFRKTVLNFPLTLGKQWKNLYQVDEPGGWGSMVAVDYNETFRALGWEELQVRAGKFKAIKVEYKLEPSWREGIGWVSGTESKALYWYSPEVKNFVKCEYEKDYKESRSPGKGVRENWELVSYELKK